MDRLITWLTSKFSRVSDIEEAASLRWRADVNRRTVLFLLLVASIGVYVYTSAIQPPEEFPIEELVTIPSGVSVQQIGTELEAQGVIRSPLAFRVFMSLLGRERGARAGDYLFKQPLTVWGVARAVATGAFGLEPTRIRIPEGATTKQMAVIYGKQLLRFNPEKFLAEAKPLEGHLFPDTYFFLPNSTESSLVQAMHQNFEDHVSQIASQFASSTHTKEEIIIMASILEKEAYDATDRRMISGVLWNRLAKNMALQVDATFLYTIGKGTFDLTMKDLVTDDPYNTYTNKGLPPTPIGSPSMDSIEAALNPIKNDYLFYLADSSGVTHYSKTYEEHLRKKRLYLGT